jgi:hypothetical protein
MGIVEVAALAANHDAPRERPLLTLALALDVVKFFAVVPIFVALEISEAFARLWKLREGTLRTLHRQLCLCDLSLCWFDLERASLRHPIRANLKLKPIGQIVDALEERDQLVGIFHERIEFRILALGPRSGRFR